MTHRHVAPYVDRQQQQQHHHAGNNNRGTVTVFQPQSRREVIERQPYSDQMDGMEDASEVEDNFMETLATSDPGARAPPEVPVVASEEVLDVAAFNPANLQVQFANYQNDEPQRQAEVKDLIRSSKTTSN